MTSNVPTAGALRRPGAGFVVAGALAAAGGLAYLGTHDPHVAGAYPACVLYSATGIYCPACGGTRAAYDLMHGDVAGAMARNPAVPVLLVAVLLFLAYRVTYRRRHGAAAPAVPTWVPVGIGVATLVFGVLRNIPGWDWLSPA
jgi:Protein of unknown function (DUF2752)